MTKSALSKGLYFILMMSLSQIAIAHSGHAYTHGFLEGLAHPLTGIDHLVAMIALGLWAGRYWSRQTWRLTLLFTCAMLGGASLFLQGSQVTGLEFSILLSIPVLLILNGKHSQIRSSLAMLVAIVFGMIHGAAHGPEMAVDTSSLAFLSGMALMSIILQGIGVSLAHLAQRHVILGIKQL